jgi:hypothetical protein
VLDQAQTITPDSEDQDEKMKKWFEQLGPTILGSTRCSARGPSAAALRREAAGASRG